MKAPSICLMVELRARICLMAELRAIICLDIMGVQASGCLGVVGVSGHAHRTQSGTAGVSADARRDL